MKMIAGYLEPTAGRVLVDGIEVERDRAVAQARLGYLPENCPLYPEMTVLEHLDFAAEMRALHGAARLAAVARALARSEERRGGDACVSKGRSQGSAAH